jgi:hypothetical protein
MGLLWAGLVLVCLFNLSTIAEFTPKTDVEEGDYSTLNNCCLDPASTTTVDHASLTVDIFTIISNPKDYQYIARGDFWVTFHLLVLYAPNNVRIHIYTDTQKIIDIGMAQGYYMYDLRLMTELDNAFMSMYRPNHHSINTVEYEYLCFYRWHLFRNIIDNWGKMHSGEHYKPIQNIITMDSDVVITMDPTKFYAQVLSSLKYQSSNDFELIIIAPGKILGVGLV